MAGAYLANNLISSSVTISVSSEDENYPRSNLYDHQAARVFRSESHTALTILIDLNSARNVNTLAIINHNLSPSAVLSLKAGASSPPAAVVATPVYREHDLWAGFTLTSARYWQLEISDANSDNIEIGQFLLGVRTALPRARRIGESYSPARKRSTIAGETYAGVFWTYHLFDRRHFNPAFRVGSAAELAVLQALDADVYGNLWPFIYIPDASGTDVYYVRKEMDFEPVELDRIGGGELAHDYAMTLVEESRGLDIQE